MEARMNWIRVSVVLSEKVSMFISQVLEDWPPQANVSNQLYFGGGGVHFSSICGLFTCTNDFGLSRLMWLSYSRMFWNHDKLFFYSGQRESSFWDDTWRTLLILQSGEIRVHVFEYYIPVSRNFRKSCISFIIYSIW